MTNSTGRVEIADIYAKKAQQILPLIYKFHEPDVLFGTFGLK